MINRYLMVGDMELSWADRIILAHMAYIDTTGQAVKTIEALSAIMVPLVAPPFQAQLRLYKRQRRRRMRRLRRMRHRHGTDQH